MPEAAPKRALQALKLATEAPISRAMSVRVGQRVLVAVILIAALGAATAIKLTSTQGLHNRLANRLQTARTRLSEALQKTSYFLEDDADMVGVHDDAAAAEFNRYAHVRRRDQGQYAVVSVQWVRHSPSGKLVPPAAPDPNPGPTPILIAPADRADSALADAAHQQAAAPAIRVASLRKAVSVSSPVTLANGHRAFYLAVPVDGHRYSGSLSKAESQSALVGLVDAQTFAVQALGSRAFRLRDGGTPLATSASSLNDALRAVMLAGGRRWNLAVSGGSLTAIEAALPVLVLLSGFGLAAAVLVILGNAARRRDAALQLAEERWAENQRLLASSVEEANTDSLTSLPNRRALMRDLDRQLTEASEERPLMLALFDLNGFKQYNDTFGHPAGDALLARLGNSLQRAVDGSATAYRLGGDEFCVLATADASGGAAIAARAASALSETGEAFTINCAHGVANLPREAHSSSEALRLADQRMYERKAGRPSALRESTDVLLTVLSERSPGLLEHISEVAQLSWMLAQRLGLSSAEVDRIKLAAELHDIGKVAIPDAILNKPGPLDEAEWEFIRRHTAIGERILTAAPSLAHTAEIARHHHERHDGTGYPDGLAGEEITLGASIIAVCDAFAAMTSDRPYSAAITVAEALSELHRCSGTQFRPAVVQAFCEHLELPVMPYADAGSPSVSSHSSEHAGTRMP
jgi:diguanylate cyclase (GGDEF)-like protein/putative nucleotidyltransferase with HDIG domain